MYSVSVNSQWLRMYSTVVCEPWQVSLPWMFHDRPSRSSRSWPPASREYPPQLPSPGSCTSVFWILIPFKWIRIKIWMQIRIHKGVIVGREKISLINFENFMLKKREGHQLTLAMRHTGAQGTCGATHWGTRHRWCGDRVPTYVPTPPTVPCFEFVFLLYGSGSKILLTMNKIKKYNFLKRNP